MRERVRHRVTLIARHTLTRYLALSAVGFAVDLGLLTIMHRCTTMPGAAVVSIAFWLTYALNFFLNRRLAFDAAGGPIGRQLVRFLPQVLGDFALTLTSVLGLQAIGVDLTVARVIAGATNLTFNYVLYRWWTFRRQRPASRSGETAGRMRPVGDGHDSAGGRPPARAAR